MKLIENPICCIVSLLCTLLGSGVCAASPYIHSTQESFRYSGYEYLWSVIDEEFEPRSFDDQDQTKRYRELIDIVIRTGATYSQPYRNSSFGLMQLYPELLNIDPDPPLYVQYRYHSSQAQNGSESPDEDYQGHADALVKIAQRMDDAGYPAYIRGATWIRAAEFFRDAGMEETERGILARRSGMDTLVEAASLEGVDPKHQEFVAERLNNFGWKYSALTEQDKGLYCERLLTDTNADPWIGNYAYACLMVDQAWEARGDGWSYEVSEKDWAIFMGRLRDAHTHLTRAWEQHPHWPLAPTKLITVQMGGGIDPVRDEAFWFDEATKYRVDHEIAYDTFCNTLMPRWGGSVELMFALLDYVLDLSGEHPNLVYIALEIMSDITWSEEDAHIALLNEQYLSAVTQLAREELDQPLGYKNVWQRRAMLRTFALGHYKLGNLEVCAELLGAGGGMTDVVRYPWLETAAFTTDAPMLATGAYENVTEAIRMAKQGEDAQAIRAYKRALKQLKRNPPDPQIMGDPVDSLKGVIERMEARQPQQPLLSNPLFIWGAGGLVVLLLTGLIMRRLISSSGGGS